MPSVGLYLLVFGATCLCGYIYPSCGLFGYNHLWDTSLILVCLMHTLSSLHALLCLPCLLYATHLAFFTSLHLCMFAYMFMHESLLACVIKPNSYYLVLVHTHFWYVRPQVPCRNFAWWHVSILKSHRIMNTRSKPTFVLVEHPLLFDNIFVFPRLAFFDSFSFSVLSF